MNLETMFWPLSFYNSHASTCVIACLVTGQLMTWDLSFLGPVPLLSLRRALSIQLSDPEPSALSLSASPLWPWPVIPIALSPGRNGALERETGTWG